MLIYYCITIIANLIAIIAFYKNINITGLSIVPLFLIALMIFQALMFKHEKVENGFRTKYGSNLTADEENDMQSVASKFLYAAIPWMIPFIVFFTSPIKLISVLVYIIGFIGGSLLYVLKNKNKITDRMSAEEKERQEQEKKEQQGKWK